MALGWSTIGAPLSSAFGIAGFSLLLNLCGFKIAFLVVGILLVVLGLASLFLVKNNPAEVGQLPDNMDPEVAGRLLKETGQETETEETSISFGTVLKTPNTWLISIGYGLLWMVAVGVVSQFIPRMMSVGYAQSQAFTFLTVASVIAFFGSYFWGWLDGKIGTKITSVLYSASFVVALLILIFASSQVLIWIGCIFIGLGLSGLLTLMPSMTITVFGKEGFKQANSVIMTIAALIRVLAFLVMAVCLKISGGNYTLPYLVFIGAAIVGAIVILCIRKKKS